MNGISERLLEQRARIVSAAISVGRNPDTITLIAVSKRQSVESIRAAYDAGQRHFGENYVQELVEKADALRDLRDIRWHLIGYLQSNKVRFIAGLVERVHTISSVNLAVELGKRMGQKRRTMAGSPEGVRVLAEKGQLGPPGSTLPLGVLVEVNVGGEESKTGCKPKEVSEVLRAIDEQPFLVAKGLMTIPPATDDAEGARPYFQQLMALRDLNGGAERLPEMSFGMSADAEVAVQVGATYVRVGTAIFGPRPG
jgi:pyridoxal phosphate enzyme (YggS family)